MVELDVVELDVVELDVVELDVVELDVVELDVTLAVDWIGLWVRSGQVGAWASDLGGLDLRLGRLRLAEGRLVEGENGRESWKRGMERPEPY